MKNINKHINVHLMTHLRNPLHKLKTSIYVFNVVHMDIGASTESMIRFRISNSIYESLPNLIKK